MKTTVEERTSPQDTTTTSEQTTIFEETTSIEQTSTVRAITSSGESTTVEERITDGEATTILGETTGVKQTIIAEHASTAKATTALEQTTTIKEATAAERATIPKETTFVEHTTAARDATTSEVTTTFEKATSTEQTTTARATTVPEEITTVEDASTGEVTTILGETTAVERTTISEEIITAEQITATKTTTIGEDRTMPEAATIIKVATTPDAVETTIVEVTTTIRDTTAEGTSSIEARTVPHVSVISEGTTTAEEYTDVVKLSRSFMAEKADSLQQSTTMDTAEVVTEENNILDIKSTSEPITSIETTSSTPSYTSSGTKGPVVNPCLNGIYWNVNGIRVAGTGSPGDNPNELVNPSGIYLDSNNNLYISDTTNSRVMKYSYGASSGTVVAGVTGSYGQELNQLSHTSYLYVDSNENLYIVDTGNNRVMYWPNGASTGSILAGDDTSETSFNPLDSPQGIWVDSNSNVFITEYNNHCVTKWVPGSSSGIVVAGESGSQGYTLDKLSNPTGLFFDENNEDLYISNADSQTIVKWHIGDTSGTVRAGIPEVSGSNTTLLHYPEGITFDRWMNLYVADSANNRVQLFCNGSNIGITIAGNGSGGKSISSPSDIKFDPEMNLYVSEYYGYQITKFHKL